MYKLGIFHEIMTLRVKRNEQILKPFENHENPITLDFVQSLITLKD